MVWLMLGISLHAEKRVIGLVRRLGQIVDGEDDVVSDAFEHFQRCGDGELRTLPTFHL